MSIDHGGDQEGFQIAQLQAISTEQQLEHLFYRHMFYVEGHSRSIPANKKNIAVTIIAQFVI